MYTLIAENPYGEQLELTHNPAYAIAEIAGLDPPDASINTSRNAGFDGAVFNSAYMNSRTITITIAINYPAEENRINLYKYFKSKFPVRLYYKNVRRDVYIDGYVQSLQVAFFKKKETAQITVFCPKPQFNGKQGDTQEYSNLHALFEFPFEIEIEEGVVQSIPFSELVFGEEKSIINRGDLETGVTIEIQAFGSVTNPKIYNTGTSQYFGLSITLEEGDLIRINTRQSEKEVSLTRAGITTNIIGYLDQGSTWFQLTPGDNVFTVVADENPENMNVMFKIIEQYEGV